MKLGGPIGDNGTRGPRNVTGPFGAIMPYQKIIERFGYFLKLRGLSLTKERRQILETICDLNRIFTVDDLYFALHTSGKKISKATIYRTIQLFIEGAFCASRA